MAQLVLFAKIVLVILAFDPQASDAFSLVKSTISHATGLVLTALVVVLVFRDGWRTLPWSASHLAVAALTFAFAASTLFALDQTVALFGVWRRYLGMTQMLDFAFLYAAIVVIIRSAADTRRLLAVMIAAASIVVGYGLVQATGRDLVRYPQGIPISTIGQPDVLGGFASIVFSTSLAWLVLGRSRSVAARAGMTCLTVATTALMFALPARNAILGTSAGLLAIIVISFIQKRPTRHVLLGTAVIAALLFAASPASARIRPEALAIDPSAQSRLELWATSAQFIAGRPVLGLGPDNLAVAYPSARSERSEAILPGYLQNSTHDWLMYFATSAGLAGAIAVSFVAALGVRSGLRLARQGDPAALALVPLAAYLGQGLVDVNEVVIDLVFWVSIGVLAASTGRMIGRRNVQRESAPFYVAAAVGVILALWGGAAQYSRVLASEALHESEQLVAAGRPLEAVQRARAATALDPRRGEYWSAFGTALAAAGNSSAAASAYLDAASLEPSVGIFWRDAALQKLQGGETDRALSLLERATQADPYDAESLDLLAKLAFNRADYARAASAGERAVRLKPEIASVYEAPAQAHAALKQWPDAEGLLLAGIAKTKSVHLQVMLARVYASTNRTAMALEEIRLVFQRDPGNPEALTLQNEITK